MIPLTERSNQDQNIGKAFKRMIRVHNRAYDAFSLHMSGKRDTLDWEGAIESSIGFGLLIGLLLIAASFALSW